MYGSPRSRCWTRGSSPESPVSTRTSPPGSTPRSLSPPTFDQLTAVQAQAALRHQLALQLQQAIVPEMPALQRLPGTAGDGPLPARGPGVPRGRRLVRRPPAAQRQGTGRGRRHRRARHRLRHRNGRPAQRAAGAGVHRAHPGTAHGVAERGHPQHARGTRQRPRSAHSTIRPTGHCAGRAPGICRCCWYATAGRGCSIRRGTSCWGPCRPPSTRRRPPN